MKRILFLLVLFGIASSFIIAFASVTQADSFISDSDSITVKVTESMKIGPITIKTSDQLDKTNPIDLMLDSITKSMGFAMAAGVIVYVLFLVAIIVLLVYLIRSSRQREKQKQELFLKFIESGHPIPDYLKRATNARNRFRKNGIMWLAIGIGLIFVVKEIAIIPVLVGIAYLLLFFIEEKNPDNE